MSLPDVTCAGGLTIDLFGIKLGLQQALPQQMPRPRLSVLLERFLQLSTEFGQADGQPRLMPFWLPTRWVEPGMAPEQVRCTHDVTRVCQNSASAVRSLCTACRVQQVEPSKQQVVCTVGTLPALPHRGKMCMEGIQMLSEACLQPGCCPGVIRCELCR